MPKLVVTHGDGTQTVPLTDQPITIGRDPDNGFTIDRPDISRRHCRVEPGPDGGWRVVDLGSKNGTFLNGKQVESASFAPRDTLQIGDVTIVLQPDEPKPASASGSSADGFSILIEESDDKRDGSGSKLPKRGTRDYLKEKLLRLNLVSQAISSELDLDRLLDAILDAVIDFTGFDRGLLLLADEGGDLKPVIGRGLDQTKIPEEERQFSKGVIDATLERRDMTFVGPGGDRGPPQSFDPRSSWASLNLKCALCVPLISPLRRAATTRYGDSDRRRARAPVRVLGLIYLDSQKPISPFDPSDRRLLRTVAAQAAIALQNARLHHQATTDALTGLVNRGFFEQVLHEELKRAREESLPLSILMIDLDKFKLVNDRHGHQAGDVVLREVAKRVREALRRDDVAGRYGGEELVVILPGVDLENARAVGQKLRSAIKATPITEHELTITASIGVSTYPEHGRDAGSLVKRADQALYQAKAEGRDRVEVWRPALDRLGKRNDPVAGLVSGDAARDQRNLSALIWVIDSIVRGQATADEILAGTLDKVVDMTRAERGLLFLTRPAGAAPPADAVLGSGPHPLTPGGEPVDLVMARGRGGRDLRSTPLRWSTSTLRSAIEERRALVLLDAETGKSWKREQVSASIEDLRLKTVMCVPLVARDRTLGAIYVDDKASAKEFGQSDLVALEAIARQLAMAIAFDPRFSRDADAASETEKLKLEVEKLKAENAKLKGGS